MVETISWQLVWPTTGLCLVVGYLLGGIPFGLLLTKMAGLGDVRTIGSGNIGATNVLRTGNKKLAIATLLLDALKGTVAVLIGNYFGAEYGLIAGLGAMIGHIFPIWLGFKGGKGVATFAGILLAVAWQAIVAFALVWLTTAFLTRYSSLAALVATVAVPIVLYATGLTNPALLSLVLAALIFLKHRANIRRLLNGTEPKIGKKG